ncbi:MAG: DUF2723 domain-containing protein, partial [candidate division Zixibacteria bacterium]|nr:DUF2723 domain-containing protein [candidate division Zixibacteria bacterium]
MSTTSPVDVRHRERLLTFLTVTLLSAVVYWITCYPSITWWDSSEYSAAASVLGVPHPPGSLLLVILGWIATRLVPGISDALTLNLLAGVMGAVACGLVVIAGFRLMDMVGTAGRASRTQSGIAATIGVGLGALTLALTRPLWMHATKFTPYILTALFTVAIVLVFFQWWQRADRRDGIHWLFTLTLLLGLDFSVHRTNSLLIPGLVVGILLRYPQTVLKMRNWLGAIAGMVVGLSFSLITIPIA